MANAVFFSNTAQQTTLSGSIAAGATTITVGATTGFPSSFPYVLALDFGAATEELVSVTAAAGTNLTITRAYGGTSAQSHSLGAAVRHVYDATEATAYRTHEAASAAVHGLTGTVVGTSDSQTLSNKTLTAPTVTNPTMTGGGSLAGTYTGTPTFSGAVVLSGTPSISAGAALTGTFTGTPAFSGAVVLSGTPSISAGASLAGTFTGTPTFSGNLTFSGNPQVTGLMQHLRTPSTAEAWEIYVSGDANPTLKARTNGTLLWGPGGASGVDTNLYRGSSGVLVTDGGLKVGGALTDNSTGITYKSQQQGSVTISFTTQTSFTQSVTFPTAFAATPAVTTNINSGVAATASWGSRGITVSSTGFTLFVFGPSATWSSVAVQWVATAQ